MGSKQVSRSNFYIFKSSLVFLILFVLIFPVIRIAIKAALETDSLTAIHQGMPANVFSLVFVFLSVSVIGLILLALLFLNGFEERWVEGLAARVLKKRKKERGPSQDDEIQRLNQKVQQLQRELNSLKMCLQAVSSPLPATLRSNAPKLRVLGGGEGRGKPTPLVVLDGQKKNHI